MRKALRIISLVSFSLLALILCPIHAFGQTPESDLRSKRINLHLTDATLLLTLGELAVHSRIPIGFEISRDDKNEVRLNVDVNDSSLEEVLDLIVQQAPNYRWEVRDNIINIVPVSRDEFLEKLLSTHIEHFTSRKDANKFEIRDAILNLAEVQSLLKTNKMTISKVDYLTRPSIYSKEVDLTISDTDVRGILNKVINASEHKIWVVQLRGEKKDSVQIAF